MIKTGIDEMDGLLNGGIPEVKSLVYYNQPGVESDIFSLQMIKNTLKNGRTAVYIASSNSPFMIRDQFREFGWYKPPLKGKFLFVDAYSSLIGDPSEERFVVSDPEDINELNKIIQDILKELTPSTIVFGSLSTIMDLCGEKKTIEAVKSWNKLANQYDHVMIYNFTAWEYSPDTMNMIKNELFNAVIAIGGITGHIIFGHYLGINKFDWKKKDRHYLPFAYENSGYIHDYSPKSTPWIEYKVEGPNVRILGENSMVYPFFF